MTEAGAPANWLTFRAEAEFTTVENELYALMSRIGEACYQAGWMSGLEVALWAKAQGEHVPFGRNPVDAADVARCSALAEQAGHWIVWLDDEQLTGLEADLWGPRAVPLAEWQLMFGARLPLP